MVILDLSVFATYHMAVWTGPGFLENYIVKVSSAHSPMPEETGLNDAMEKSSTNIDPEINNMGTKFPIQVANASIPPWEYCEVCELHKKWYSHHCVVCGKCVVRMDHHCRKLV